MRQLIFAADIALITLRNNTTVAKNMRNMSIFQDIIFDCVTSTRVYMGKWMNTKETQQQGNVK